MSMFFGHWDEDDNSADEIEKIKNELIEDSSLFGMHWRDFDIEAEEIWRERNNVNSEQEE